MNPKNAAGQQHDSSQRSQEVALKNHNEQDADTAELKRALVLTDQLIQNGIDLARQYKYPQAMLELVETQTTTELSEEDLLQAQR